MKSNPPHSPASVSVVIPCYNSEKTIERAVSSILNQTLGVSEIIIIDDASEDSTPDLIAKFHFTYPNLIKVISFEENKGASAARNAGWDSSNFLYVAFLDADDSWHPNKIEIQYNWMTSNKYDVLGHEHFIEDDLDQKTCLPFIESVLKYKLITKTSVLLFTPFATPTVMVKRVLPFRFNEDKRFAEDYLLWMQIVFSSYSVAKLKIALTSTYKANFGDAGLSSNLILMELGVLDAYKKLFDMGLINVFLLFFLILYSSLKFVRRLMIVYIRKMGFR